MRYALQDTTQPALLRRFPTVAACGIALLESVYPFWIVRYERNARHLLNAERRPVRPYALAVRGQRQGLHVLATCWAFSQIAASQILLSDMAKRDWTGTAAARWRFIELTKS